MKTMQGCLLILKSWHGNPGWLLYHCCQFASFTWGKMGEGLSFLTPSAPFPSSFLGFSYLQHHFACQGSWQVGSLPDYWMVRSKEIESTCHRWQFIANAGAGQTQIRSRWGRQRATYESGKAGLIKRIREEVLFSVFVSWASSGVRNLKPWVLAEA